MDLKSVTLEVCRVARDTGAYLRSERKNFKPENVLEKGARDFVSYVDRGAEQMAVKALSELLPEAGFITEEGTVEQSDTGLNWVIDPLDGTTNFIHDNAPYCVSIALRRDSETLLGVVYEVCRGECYYAWKDGGTWMDGERLKVSSDRLDRSLVCFELPYDTERYKPVFLELVKEFYGRAASIRVNGSSALSLCYVAAGRFGGWAEALIKPWDYAAGIILVREAGGTVTNFGGGSEITDKHDVLATNGVIHAELESVLARLPFTKE